MSEFTDELLADAKDRMAKSVEACRHELATVRTGRASPHLLDRVVVDYYGAETPLRQLAQIAATDARLLTVMPYDKSAIKSIEKAIMESDLGLTPSNDGNVIRLQIPELNEERRQEMVKVVHGVAEEGKVEVRWRTAPRRGRSRSSWTGTPAGPPSGASPSSRAFARELWPSSGPSRTP